MSEGEVHGYADALAVDWVGDIEVGQAPHVVHAQASQYVFNAYARLHVGR